MKHNNLGGFVGGWRPRLVHSPIFSLRLVHMPVGASPHFAALVLKQVLHSLPFAREFHFKIIVHLFNTGVASSALFFIYYLFKKKKKNRKRSFFPGRRLDSIIRLVASSPPSVGPSFFSPAAASRFPVRLFAPSGVCVCVRAWPDGAGFGETSPKCVPFSLCRCLLRRDALQSGNDGRIPARYCRKAT